MFRTLEVSDPALAPSGLRFVTVKSAALGQRADVLLHVPPQAAARALVEHTDLAPADIVKKSLTIAGDLCIYTNQQHTIEVLE